MKLVVCLCLFALVFFSVSGDDYVHLPQWPTTWISTWYYFLDSNGTLLQQGKWYYDWTRLALRQDNDFGGCIYANQTNPCTFIFIANMTYIVQLDTGACCIFSTSLAASSPTWLYDTQYVSVGKYKYSNVTSTVWNRPSTGETYFQAKEIQLPAAISGSGTTITWGNFNFDDIPASVFHIPNTCTSMCPGSLSETQRVFSPAWQKVVTKRQ